MLESTPLEEEVEHAVDAIANDGAAYSLNDPKNKVGHVSPPFFSLKGFTAMIAVFYRVKIIFSNKLS